MGRIIRVGAGLTSGGPPLISLVLAYNLYTHGHSVRPALMHPQYGTHLLGDSSPSSIGARRAKLLSNGLAARAIGDGLELRPAQENDSGGSQRRDPTELGQGRLHFGYERTGAK